MLACIFSEDCVTYTLYSLKTMLASAEEPLGQEEPEGKNSPNTVAPTPAYIIQRSLIHPGRERIAEEAVWEHRYMHQGISQKTDFIILETSLTLLLFEYLHQAKIEQVLMSLHKGQ